MSTGPSAIASVFAAIRLPILPISPDVAFASVVGFVVLRPIIQRHRRQPRLELFGVAALAGRPAYVVQDVTDWDGTVRISGEEWTARAFDQNL
ncbi:MAG TPA: NfeD family protein, partial [Pseudonocardiaceae bacterium]|nr:NfeD family protein [Pseudonocardiaceae bacterium]